MYISQFEIQNYRCFRSRQVLDFTGGQGGRPRQWTVILGDNGTGKTTVLQEIGGNVAPVRNFSRSLGLKSNRDCDIGIHNAANGAWGSIDESGLSFLSNYILAEIYETSEYIKRGFVGSLDRAMAEFMYRLTSRITFCLGVGGGDSASWWHGKYLSIAFRFNPLNKTAPAIAGYGGNRRMTSASLSKEKTASDPILTLMDDNAALPDAEEWILRADYADKSGAATGKKPVFEQAKEIFLRLLPEIDDIRIAWTEGKAKAPYIEFHSPYGWVRLKDLSLGYRSMIAWVGDFARRLFEQYPDSDDPLGEPAICLVDEIDLHLHPRWQRQIIGFLSERFKKTQFIVTAHSPLIVQAAADANLVLLRRDGNEVVIDQSHQAIRGWRLDQVLTSDLFGLESARPPGYADKLEERRKLLEKSRLTKQDKARLKEIEADLGELPVGESASDREAMDLIRRAAARLKAEQGPTG